MNIRLNYRSWHANRAATFKKKKQVENTSDKTSIINLTHIIAKYKTALQLYTTQAIMFCKLGASSDNIPTWFFFFFFHSSFGISQGKKNHGSI